MSVTEESNLEIYKRASVVEHSLSNEIPFSDPTKYHLKGSDLMLGPEYLVKICIFI